MADIAWAVIANHRNVDAFARVYGLADYRGPTYGDERRAYVAAVDAVRHHLQRRQERGDNPCRFLLDLGDLIAKVDVVSGSQSRRRA